MSHVHFAPDVGRDRGISSCWNGTWLVQSVSYIITGFESRQGMSSAVQAGSVSEPAEESV